MTTITTPETHHTRAVARMELNRLIEQANAREVA